MAQAPHAPSVLLGRYRLGPELGRGAHGVVYLAEDLGRGGQHVALKLINETAGGAGFIQPAAQILRWVRHPNWAEILDTGMAAEGQWFEALRYVKGRSLAELEGPQAPELVWKFLEDGGRVLQTLHRHDLIHYDVTPGNFLMEETEDGPRFVLTDGGLAHKGPVVGVARGTPLFMAPEVTEDTGHDSRVDLYSLGLVAFRLATGTDPFTGDPLDVLSARRADVVPRASSVLPSIDPALDDVIASLLSRRAGDRPATGEALLRAIAKARGLEHRPMLPEEAAAASEGSALVGRKKQVTRFRHAADILAAALPSTKPRSGRRSHISITDPVLLLHGPQGAGITHLLRNMCDEARALEVPVLLLAGRDGAPDPGAPLQHLEAALRALHSPQEESPEEQGQALWTGRDRRERAYSKQRAIEHFLRIVREAAKTTPFVLAVEDYGDLPPLARDAISALSRDLLSRSEHGSRTEALPILLAVDLGCATHDPLLILDSANRSQPLAPVGTLSEAELDELITARLPDITLPRSDVHDLAQVCDSLPGRLARMIAEGAQRGEISPHENDWVWDLTHIGEYEVGAQLSGSLAHALHQARGPFRKLLEYLSLLESPLTEHVAATLVPEIGGRSLALAPLVVTRMHGSQRVYALASHALRKAVLEKFSAHQEPALSEELLAALSADPAPQYAVDMAKLELALGRPAACLDTLSLYVGQIGAETRYQTQAIVLDAVSSPHDVLSAATRRSQVAELLERGPDAVRVAQMLALAFSRDGSELTAVLRTADVLADAEDPEAATALLRSQEDATSAAPLERALLFIRRSKRALDLHQVDEGQTLLSAARIELRAARTGAPISPALSAEYLVQLARSYFLRRKTSQALRCLRAAESAARRAHDRQLRAHILNNLGNAYAQGHMADLARKAFQRSQRLKRAMGDVKGDTNTSINLARLHARANDLQSAITLCNAGVKRAQRFALPETLLSALRQLADCLDQSHRPMQALQTLERAWRASGPTKESVRSTEVAWSLAPLAAILGRTDLAEAALLVTARAARAPNAADKARGLHHLVSTMVALHSGLRSRASVSFSRAVRHLASLNPEERHICAGLSYVLRTDEAQDLQELLAGLERYSARPAQHLLEVVRWRDRLARSAADDAPVPPTFLGERGERVRGVCAGQYGRIATEIVLSSAKRYATQVAPSVLNDIETYAATHGLLNLRARTLGILALRPVPQQAQLLSKAIQEYERVNKSSVRALQGVCEELQSAAEDLCAELRISDVSIRSRRDLHAAAHQIMVAHGSTASSDGRLAVALRRVLSLSAQMQSAGGLGSLLDAITHHACDVTGAERACTILLVEEEGNLLVEEEGKEKRKEIWANQDANQDAQPEAHRKALKALSETVVGRVFDTQSAVYVPYVPRGDEGAPQSLSFSGAFTSAGAFVQIPSVIQDKDFGETTKELGLSSILCVPMMRRGTLYGVLYADTTSRAAAFDHVDLEVLLLFAEQAAAAIEASGLIEDLQRSFARTKAMQDRLLKGERLRVIGELSSGVAHEFNNLLTAILARIQMMALNYLEPGARKDLDLIERASLDAAAVVRRLQGFSRRQRQADFTTVDLGSLCRDAIDMLRPLWRSRRRDGRGAISVQVYAEDGLLVRGDPTELREVVTNVIKNAIDSIEDEGHVVVSVERRGGQVRMVIRDTGSGIPAEVQSKVFDPFFTTKGERGTGLGMPLCQQIVERHGGAISLASQEGEGTTVTVSLPGTEGSQDPSRAPSRPSTTKHDPITVLVVDDDSQVRNTLSDYLEKEGHKVMTARDGVEGLKAAANGNAQVVLTDIRMPEMDGIELCRRLHTAQPKLPVVLMSGWTAELDKAQAKEAGAREFLPKPLDMKQVLSLIASVAQDTD